MKVLILSGIPGSGKTTYAICVALEARKGFEVMIVSADHYFVQNGVYKFDGSKLGEAHQQCFRNYLYAIVGGKPHTVIVDNTNTRAEDIVRYADPALALGHDLEILTFRCPAALGAARNTHGVPFAGCLKMAETLGRRELPAPLRRYAREIQVD